MSSCVENGLGGLNFLYPLLDLGEKKRIERHMHEASVKKKSFLNLKLEHAL